MKRIKALLPFLAAFALLAVSCKETKEADDHANWKSRNNAYIQDIASKCNNDLTPQTAQTGDIFRLLSYKLDKEKTWGTSSYVYCQLINSGTDSVSPMFTDSVRINYRVRLIPTNNYPEGQIIDRSFKTPELDPSVNTPSSFCTSGLITGVTTALMHMHCGDHWRLYIPFGLGYGTTVSSGIPGYSTLIFEINLSEIAQTGKNLSPN